MLSLWDTLPLEIASLIVEKSKQLEFQPVVDELVLFHKQRERKYISGDCYELECIKNTITAWGYTLDVPHKGGTWNNTPGFRGKWNNHPLKFLTTDFDTGHRRYYRGGVEKFLFVRNSEWNKYDAKKELVAYVKKYFPDHEAIRKRKRFPRLDRCTNKQLMHILITSE